MTLNTNNNNRAAAFHRNSIDVTSGWNISFLINTTNCNSSSSSSSSSADCSSFGDGFTFVIQNERAGPSYLGHGKTDLGYFPPVNSFFPKSFAVIFDHTGHCTQSRSLIRLVTNTNYPSSTSISDVGLTNSNATGPLLCGKTYPVVITHNTTHLSVFYDNNTWIQHKLDLSEVLILKANRMAYIGWTMGTTAGSSFSLSNITISQFSKICTMSGQKSYLPPPSNPPPPVTDPTPPSVDPPVPSPSPLPPQPEPQSITVNIICRASCTEILNNTLTIGTEDHFPPSTTLKNLNITVSTPKLLFNSSISIHNSFLILSPSTQLLLITSPSPSTTVHIQNTQIYLNSNQSLEVVGCISLVNVNFFLPIPPSDKSHLLLTTSCLIQYSNVTVVIEEPVPCPLVLSQISTGSQIMLILVPTDCGIGKVDWVMIVGIVIGVVVFVVLATGLVLQFQKSQREKAMMSKMKKLRTRGGECE